MSELDNSPQTEKTEAPKQDKQSLTELLRVCLDNRPSVTHGPESEAAKAAAGEGSTDAKSASPSARVSPGDGLDEDTSDEAAAPRAARSNAPRPVAIAENTAGKGLSMVCQLGGAALCASGVALVLAPQLSVKFAELLGRSIDLHAHAGTMIVAGLLTFMLGTLLGSLRNLRGSLEFVRFETARLGEIAEDGQQVRETLDSVRSENTTLYEDVVQLQFKLKRLIEIVSNPDYTLSIFRLAASVDQLDKHVETSMKGQFGQLQQRIAAMAQKNEQAEQQLSTAIGQIPVLLRDQNRANQLAWKEGFDELHAAAEVTHAHIDRNMQASMQIESALKGQHEALAEGIANLSENSSLSASQVASSVGELRSRIDRQIEKQSAALLAEFAQLAERLDEAERNRVAAVQQMAEHVDAQLGVHVDGLQQDLKRIEDVAGRNGEGIADEVGRLGKRLEQATQTQQLAARETRDELTKVTRSVQTEVVSGLAQLAAYIERQADEQRIAEQVTREAAADATRTVQAELVAGLEQLCGRLEQQTQDQQRAEQATRDAAAEATRAVQAELVAGLEQLCNRLEQQTQDQQRAEQATREETARATRSVKEELALNLEQLGTQLERLECEHLAELLDASQEVQQQNGVTGREIERLRRQVEQLAGEHLAAATQVAAVTQRELQASLEQLRAHLGQLAQEQRAALDNSALDVQQTTYAAKRELVLTVEQLGLRIEKALEARSNGLANDLIDVTEIFGSITAEVRACITESLAGVSAPNPEPLAVLEPLAGPVDAQAETAGADTTDMQAEYANADTTDVQVDYEVAEQAPEALEVLDADRPEVQPEFDWNSPQAARAENDPPVAQDWPGESTPEQDRFRTAWPGEDPRD